MGKEQGCPNETYTVISLSVQIVIYYWLFFFFQSKDASLISKFSIIYDINIHFFFLQNAPETKKFSDAEEEIPLQKGPG